MYVSNRIASSSTSDSLAYLATKAAGAPVEEAADDGPAAQLAGGSYDPSAHVSLSVEALLVLSGTREGAEERLPALTEDERNNVDTAALAEREYAAFGHYLDAGDSKNYYRAFIEYFDSMLPEDQRSARYAGARENAVAALRSIAYTEKVMDATAEGAAADAVLEAERAARRATPIAAIFQPRQQDFENVARVAGRISRATSMYSIGF